MKISRGDDLGGLILNYAVRCALDRKSYIPTSLISAIRPLLADCSEETLQCMDQAVLQWLKENPYNRENYWREWNAFDHEVRQALQTRRE